MTTKRETILNAVVTALAGTSNVSTRIYRSRVTAVTRDETPALLITWDSDTPVQTTSLATLDWSLDITISIISRGDIPDKVADPVIESVHSKIMADLTLGGYATDIIPALTSNEAVDSDQPAGIVNLNYQIKYRTSNTNLATL